MAIDDLSADGQCYIAPFLVRRADPRSANPSSWRHSALKTSRIPWPALGHPLLPGEAETVRMLTVHLVATGHLGGSGAAPEGGTDPPASCCEVCLLSSAPLHLPRLVRTTCPLCVIRPVCNHFDA